MIIIVIVTVYSCSYWPVVVRRSHNGMVSIASHVHLHAWPQGSEFSPVIYSVYTDDCCRKREQCNTPITRQLLTCQSLTRCARKWSLTLLGGVVTTSLTVMPKRLLNKLTIAFKRDSTHPKTWSPVVTDQLRSLSNYLLCVPKAHLLQ